MLRVSRLKDGALGVINQWRKQCFTELNEAFLNFVGIDKDWWRQKLERLRLLIEVWGHQHHVNVSELILVVDRSVLESGLFSWFNMDILFPDSLITVAREIDYALITFTLWIAELIRFLCFFNLDAVSGNQLYVLLLKALALNLIKSGDVESNPGPSNGLTLKNLVNELIQVQTKWYAIGLQIGIESHRLKAIKQESSGLERLSEVIERWLRENTEVPVSWKSVVKALKAPSVGEKGLADQLHKKYCQPDDASGGQARHSDIQEGQLVSVSKVVTRIPHGVKVSITHEYEFRDESCSELLPGLKRFCPELKVEGEHHVEALEKDKCVQKVQRKLRRMKIRRQKLKQRIKSSRVYTHRAKNK